MTESLRYPCIMCSYGARSLENLTSHVCKKHKSDPAHAVKQLLDITRDVRVQWLKEEVSIEDICKKYPSLQTSKWVCCMGIG